MVLKRSGFSLLAGVTLLSLFLALSVYYMVRPSDHASHSNYFTNDDSDISGQHKTINSLTEILYQQLFVNKPLRVCPVYLTNICGWRINKHTENKTTGGEVSYKNTTKHKLRQFNSIIRSCQMFGITKYQDVCFYVRNSFFNIIPASRIASRLLQDCAYIHNDGYPCDVRSGVDSEYPVPQNVCVSDSETVLNILTQRCRVRTETRRNESSFIPFEDLIYEVGNYSHGNQNGVKREEMSVESENDDKNEYKSGSNKTQTGSNATAVVCHILLATLLVVSASVALFEVCRDRLGGRKVMINRFTVICRGRQIAAR
jgi:hypothetical protein